MLIILAQYRSLSNEGFYTSFLFWLYLWENIQLEKTKLTLYVEVKSQHSAKTKKGSCEVFNLAALYFNTFLLNDEDERIVITEVVSGDYPLFILTAVLELNYL